MRDVDDVFAKLRSSRFRSRFRLGAGEQRYLQKRGWAAILEHGRSFIADRLAPAEPVNDGRQTPMRGHPVFVAQHATGTCCRGCLEKWHGIPKGRAMTAEEQAYAVGVIERWLRSQFSGGADAGEQPELF